MKEHDGSLFRIRDLLGDVGGRLGLPSAVETGMVWRRWHQIVGAAVAAHAEPSSLRDGVLRVRTDSPAWATEIGYLRDQIKASVNRTVGVELVQEVRVWTGPGPLRASDKGPLPAGPNGAAARARVTSPAADPATAVARAREAWARVRRRGPGGDSTEASRDRGEPG